MATVRDVLDKAVGASLLEDGVLQGIIWEAEISNLIIQEFKMLGYASQKIVLEKLQEIHVADVGHSH